MVCEKEEVASEHPQRILIVDDQNFNIDASKIILKYSIKLCPCNEIIDSASDGQ